ncbi:hypothetical protein [Streptomyces sp. NPDC127100]|uniref:hypothetical protein n=1 Tax=Streptomyces sp. NPDC127100 TaxID=3347138 RepID=UPI0036633D7A
MNTCTSSIPCTDAATHVALMQIANPSDEHPTGIQAKRLFCEYHAMRSGAWGIWPIENDSDYGVPLGAAGLAINKVETDRRYGDISEIEYDYKIETLMGAMGDLSGPSLDKMTCADIYDRGCTNRVTDEIGVDSVCADCHEIAARAIGDIVDPVPVGSDMAPNWTRRQDSNVRWAERQERNGTRPAGHAAAVCRELSRLIRRRADREVARRTAEFRAGLAAGEIPAYEIDGRLDVIDRIAAGVTLDKA